MRAQVRVIEQELAKEREIYEIEKVNTVFMLLRAA